MDKPAENTLEFSAEKLPIKHKWNPYCLGKLINVSRMRQEDTLVRKQISVMQKNKNI